MTDRHSRVPLSGRTNRSINSVDGTRRGEGQTEKRRPATSGGLLSNGHSHSQPHQQGRDALRDAETRRRINDPLTVYRPFSPNALHEGRESLFPPMLPKSIDPTVPPVSARKKPLRPPSCPPQWIQQSTQPEAFHASSSQFHFADEEKRNISREFVSRNRDRMWKYDLKYMKKTPRTICEEMVQDPNFLGVMTKYRQKEQFIKLSSSEQALKCLSFDEDKSPSVPVHTSPLKKTIPYIGYNDPFMSSLTTAREVRDERVKNLFSPAVEHREAKFNRGFAHEPEYGTFSKFNAILKTNKGALLNR
eukprot:gene9065-10004_t